ncbi:hypothetical protein KKI22_00775 [Patescibacteria group bacterium]|nr:hypothetical protein [Patescibacteria group bacterium]
MSEQSSEINQVENQQAQESDDNEKPFTVQRPHDLNTLMKNLRETLINSASQQIDTDESEPKKP